MRYTHCICACVFILYYNKQKSGQPELLVEKYTMDLLKAYYVAVSKPKPTRKPNNQQQQVVDPPISDASKALLHALFTLCRYYQAKNWFIIVTISVEAVYDCEHKQRMTMCRWLRLCWPLFKGLSRYVFDYYTELVARRTIKFVHRWCCNACYMQRKAIFENSISSAISSES